MTSDIAALAAHRALCAARLEYISDAKTSRDPEEREVQMEAYRKDQENYRAAEGAYQKAVSTLTAEELEAALARGARAAA